MDALCVSKRSGNDEQSEDVHIEILLVSYSAMAVIEIFRDRMAMHCFVLV